MFSVLRKLFLFVLLAVSGAAFAMSIAGQTYTQAEFDSLQKSGKPTLVMVHADWCPTCRAQDPLLLDLLQTPALKGITALSVDFDTQKDVLRSFHVSKQSTLIVFKDGKEVARSTGDTNKDSLASLLKKAL
ncbi:thioredoxin family protein [Undibacterium sp.]|jgi:thioredoxin 1|uniref:thioredoxin family protein n=1 Tax=Undibacterium sp. TaxID=1914977 RepID=UPI002D0DE399|nr:thioredoxin family protein [Undibacterium sp.]HTD03056.1 thioredoxin family protein [Undibacterium sp.]